MFSGATKFAGPHLDAHPADPSRRPYTDTLLEKNLLVMSSSLIKAKSKPSVEVRLVTENVLAISNVSNTF
jgi:hypothetical protein